MDRDLGILDPAQAISRLERSSAQACLEWMFEEFGEDHYLACSFQKTSSVIAHMATELNPDARFFYLDTDVLFPETYQTRERLQERLGIEFDRYHNISLEAQARDFGDKLWETDPDQCCGLRKVTPMHQALEDVDCWVSGVRRKDSQARAKTPKLLWDKRFELWKLNPIADWSEQQVWDYIQLHQLPYNPLHDQGYASIGCTHCTVPADDRQGRWAGANKTECGINGASA